MTLLAELGSHAFALALVCGRVGPIAFLCPLFGGSHAPMHVKLGVVLALSSYLAFEGHVVPIAPVDAWTWGGMLLREVAVGLSLGLVATLPFDVARMGGRFSDLFRGSSAEAALPLAGTRESATGDLFFHLALALGSTATLSAITHNYLQTPTGQFHPTELGAMDVVAAVGGALSGGLAIGAPVAAVSLGIDLLLGLAGRASPNLHLSNSGAPLKLLAGGVVLWAGVATVASVVQQWPVASP